MIMRMVFDGRYDIETECETRTIRNNSVQLTVRTRRQ